MKKTAILLTFLLAAFWPLPAAALDRGEIVSEAACVMDADTGQILFDKNMDKLMYPASTTKIMTGLLTAELANPDDIATVSESAVDIGVWGSAHIALSPGEELPVDSLFYALMLPSANDAANALAEYVAGSQQGFALRMTDRARQIGANSTNFVNAHGLHDPQHYTTARDIALITREASKNPVFMKYFGTATHTIPSTNLQPEERPFTNYQWMLVPTTRFYDPDVLGGKVGYTTEAGHTMSTIARQDGRTLICVVMKSSSRYDKFHDTAKLLQLGFEEFSPVTIAHSAFPEFSAENADGQTVTFTASGDFSALLHNGLTAEDVLVSFSHPEPFRTDELLDARAVFSVESGNPAIPPLLGELKLNAEPPPAVITSATLEMVNTFTLDDLSAGHWRTGLLILGGAGLAFLGLLVWRQVKLQRRRKRRRERMERLRREISSQELYPLQRK